MQLSLEKNTDSQGKVTYPILLKKGDSIFRDCMAVLSTEEEALQEFEKISAKLQEPSTEVIKQIEI